MGKVIASAISKALSSGAFNRGQLARGVSISTRTIRRQIGKNIVSSGRYAIAVEAASFRFMGVVNGPEENMERVWDDCEEDDDGG